MGDLIQDIKNQSSGTPWGSIATGILGIGANLFGQNQQNQNTRDLMNLQQQHQMELNNQMQDIQQQNWDYTNYENQVKHLENAGLNVGLMYGMGGGGGQSMGGASGGSAAMGQAAQNTAPAIMDMLQKQQMVQSQIDLNNAQAGKLRSETPTSGNIGDMLLENMKQSGIAQWYENLKTEYFNKNPEDKELDNNTVYMNVIYKQQGSTPGDRSMNVEKFNADVYKTIAEKENLDANALLTNKKAQGYWTELMNETAKANAAGVQAAAMKLAAEWNTGEFTNWKTWSDLGIKAVQTAGQVIKGGANVNITNPTTTYNTTNY